MADTRGTILIADDDPATVELIADYLIGKQLAVARAQTLDEALTELDRDRPEVALIGVRLGDLGPLEAIKRIREVNVQVALLATAAQEDADLATEALGMGAADYLLKPVDFDYLSRAIEKALAAAAPVFDFTAVAEAPSTSSPQTLLYTLGLEIFRVTRRFSPEARASVGGALEQVVLQAIQRGVSGEKAEIIRTLNQTRTLIRLAQDLGDLDDATAARIEEHMVRTRRSVGLS
jgi:DNA-binding response OmpR family regulator